MNNNNRGNNRRRGRSNRQGGGNGGQPINRIDSRARGNAPQLLEKYRKLAQDSHLNGDRVQAEYYLQFADHYFRVIADQRLRQEEARGRPRDERWQDDGGEGDDSGDLNPVNDFPNFDQPAYQRQPREERPRREEREEREERDDERDHAADDAPAGDADDGNPFEPAENPFVRENRPRTGLRPRRERSPRQARDDGDNAEPAGLDPALLPPAISAARDDDGAEAKPRKRAPRRKPAAGDAGDALEPVN